MKNKGLLFTIMVLFMILAIVALNSVIKEASRQSQDIKYESALSSVGSKFGAIERTIIDLDKDGKAKEIDLRPLPFSYELNKDENYLSIEQRLPTREEDLNEFFDLINLFKVFIEDKNRSNVFDGLEVDAITIKDSRWGGTDENMNFVAEPLCYEYKIVGRNQAIFGGSDSSKCASLFQMSYIKTFDLNIVILNQDEDFDTLRCNGTSLCPEESFDTGNSNPYYRLEILDSACNNCSLSQKVVSEHFDPALDFNVFISCSGGSCISDPVIFSYNGTDFNIYHASSYSLDFNAKTTFSREIDGFKFFDFNFTVKHFSVDTNKSNDPSIFN